MNSYITGTTIKSLREKKELTQSELAEILSVSSKTISKWETGKGLPDITLIEPLSKALSVSVMELFSGQQIDNRNISSNMLRSKFYVCPVCGNIIRSMGDAVISCHGIVLPPLTPEDPDEEHKVVIEKVEDEYFLKIDHDMTKTHFISFIAHITTDKSELVKLYPEGNGETRLKLRGGGYIYFYCNKHGLMKIKL